MAVYSKTIGSSVVPAGTPVDRNALVTKINEGLTTQNFDFLPSETKVGYLGMALSETYYPEVWANTSVTADGQLRYLDKTGKLIAPALIALAVLIIVLAFYAIDVYWNVYKAEHSFAYKDPNDGTTKTILGETLYLSTMNSLYWYTCPKDGTGVGLKSKYPTLAQYQASTEYQAEMAYLKDHCASAKDIINLGDWMTTIIYGAVIIGGIYIVAKILPSLLESRKKKG